MLKFVKEVKIMFFNYYHGVSGYDFQRSDQSKSFYFWSDGMCH